MPGARGHVHQVEAFLRERLIPHMKAQGHGRSTDTKMPQPEEFLTGALAHLGRSFALAGGRWHELIPFYGRPPTGALPCESGTGSCSDCAPWGRPPP